MDDQAFEKIIGEILNANENERKILVKACYNLKPQGDIVIIFDAIKKLPINFTFTDLYKELPENKSTKLIADCMKWAQSNTAKQEINKLKKQKLSKYIPIFERYL